jgi:hypothetical protein
MDVGGEEVEGGESKCLESGIKVVFGSFHFEGRVACGIVGFEDVIFEGVVKKRKEKGSADPDRARFVDKCILVTVRRR